MKDQAERIAELKRLANEVTGWGNCDQAWEEIDEYGDSTAIVGAINEDGEKYPVATIDCDQYYAAPDSIKLARFYAAVNPQAILSLIEHVESVERENAELRQLAQASLDARGKEAKARMTADNAQENFSDSRREVDTYCKAAVDASNADKALRDALSRPVGNGLDECLSSHGPQGCNRVRCQLGKKCLAKTSAPHQPDSGSKA